MSVRASDVHVRGGATHEELAAVIALVTQGDRGDSSSEYDRWRAARLAALSPATHYPERPAKR